MAHVHLSRGTKHLQMLKTHRLAPLGFSKSTSLQEWGSFDGPYLAVSPSQVL